jgi:hypothetical protein
LAPRPATGDPANGSDGLCVWPTGVQARVKDQTGSAAERYKRVCPTHPKRGPPVCNRRTLRQCADTTIRQIEPAIHQPAPTRHYIITTRLRRTGLPFQPQYCSRTSVPPSTHSTEYLQSRGLTHSRLTELAPCCAAPLTWLFSVRDFDPSSKWLGLGRQTPNRSRTKRKLLELGPSDCCAPRRLLQTLNLSWGQRPTFCVQLSVVCCIRPASGRCSHRDPTCLTFAKAHIQDYRQHQLATLDICTRHCAMGVSKTPLIGLLTSWKAAA